jgi:multidrug efflux pump subunit AcrA (membrane-fusion protein)
LADNGTVLNAGEPVVRLVEDRVLEAWVGLPMHAAERISERAMQRLRIGQRYFDATLVGRLPEVDPVTRTRSLVLRLDDSAADYVVHGQIVRLELGETVKAEGYWLPATALTKGARGLWTCFVVSADVDNLAGPRLGRVERRDVEVLHAESNRVFVRGTLNPNDQVIADGTHRVVPGQLVRASDERLR